MQKFLKETIIIFKMKFTQNFSEKPIPEINGTRPFEWSNKMLDRKPQQKFDAPMVGVLKSIFLWQLSWFLIFWSKMFLYFDVYGWSGLDRPRFNKNGPDYSVIDCWNNWLFHMWHNCWCRQLEVRVTGSIFLRNEKSLHAENYASWFLVCTDLSGITWWFSSEKRRNWQNIRPQRQIIRWNFSFGESKLLSVQ